MRTTLIVSVPLLLLATAAVIVAQAPPPTRGKVQNFVIEERPDGTVVHRTADGKIVQTFDAPAAAQPQAGARFAVPVNTPEGHKVFVYGGYGQAPDADTAKIMQEEAAAAQQVRELMAEHQQAESDADKEKVKMQLREKLAVIFDMQQQRRAREVAKIEERLGKLKETMKKREAAKDSIIDRRLDTLTGGVDELGWEETFPLGGPNAANQYGTPGYPERSPFAPVPAPATRGEFSFPPAVVPAPSAAPPAGLPALTPPVPTAPRTVPATPALPPAAPAAPRISPPASTAANDFIGR
jgi:hypothetical protein